MNRHNSAVEYMRRPATIRHASSRRSVTVLIHRSVTGTPIAAYQATASATVLSGTGDTFSDAGGSGTRTGGSTLVMGISPFRPTPSVYRPTTTYARTNPTNCV